MVLTGRAALLTLLGVLWVGLVQPGWTGIGVWLGVLVAAAGLDVGLAGSPAGLDLRRDARQAVRLGGTVTTTLTVLNGGRRPPRGAPRGAGQPPAGGGGGPPPPAPGPPGRPGG